MALLTESASTGLYFITGTGLVETIDVGLYAIDSTFLTEDPSSPGLYIMAEPPAEPPTEPPTETPAETTAELVNGFYIPPQDSYRSHRSPTWTVNIVGGGTLDGVQGVDITRSASASIKGRGYLNIVDVGQDIDWEHVRLAPRYSTGAGAEWGIGHYVATAPQEQWADGKRSWSIEVFDVNQDLDRRKITDTLQLLAGANVATAIATLLADAGETLTAITDNGETLRTTQTWPAGTSYLEIINKLATKTGGYFSLSVDLDGRFTLAPYVRPQARATRHEFLDGNTSIHSGKFTVERNVDIPEQIIAVTAGTDTTAALVGYAPDAGTYAYADTVDTDSTSQAEATAYAFQVYYARRAKRTTLTINHAPMPLAPSDVIRFRSTAAGLDGKFVVQSTKEATTSLDLAQTTLTEVQ